LNLTDPDNPSNRRAIQWQDWLGMDQETRNRVLPQVKTSGFLPPSLKSALARMARVQDPAELEQTLQRADGQWRWGLDAGWFS
jgi:hypothetical protein